MNSSEIEKMYETVDRILADRERPEIFPNPMPIYEHPYSKHPESLRVSFGDGSTAVYDIRVEQPAPVIIENIRIIRKWKQGYVNKPARRRGRQ